ncbi:MAG: adenosylcobinamide-phosphate synthase CbiB [Eubacteriales bacterium]|nr:adenosylcobinamide-phosphate synthase CbiB [Eubacteriales bacterium]
MIELAILCGFILDLILGDPRWMPHPVVMMGKCISFLEKHLRNIFPKTDKGEFWAGLVMAVIITAGTGAITWLICFIAWEINSWLFFAVQTLWCWQCVAIKDLKAESMEVYRRLKDHDLEAARKYVSRIVGRDTQALTDIGVTKAAVETIAEGFSDGVMAPVLYMMIGGAPLAMTYKAINTMDSMVGYKNERYLYFGRIGAHFDDVVGYIPARLSAIVWIITAFLTGNDAKNAWKIWRRDHMKHASPNSAHTETACAGALRIQLAGPAYYFGEYYDKPYLGDPLRPVEDDDIKRANKMLYVSSILTYVIGLTIRFLIWRFI